ncbi:Cupin superfamily protein [Chitinophaga niastensis]|uniref:Cupin superfamily protein n=1 Tax=Chitinophaga niastensis TaxID=536980 RepID=A0A2P8HJB2_CHINA|nr:cupin domain-containing protein [Chitinophaga niastensis]PSL46304.1 Cupin superfamily protein [Chitinophaga niastensis]
MQNKHLTNEGLLPWLIGPTSADEFWSEYWDKKLLLRKRNDPAYFNNFITVADFDKLLSFIHVPHTNFDMAKAAAPISKDKFCTGSRVDMNKVLKLHKDGATIILRAIHLWSEPLEKLRLSFESIFKFPAQINVYLTPPENQSTPPHWDTHDLFILQLEGSKNWKIFDAAYEAPLKDQDFVPGIHPVGPLQGEYMLEAGDVMYIPRGTIHEPQSTTYSIHAAIGIKVLRWADVFNKYIDLYSKTHVDLRKTLPIHAMKHPGDMTDLISAFKDMFIKTDENLMQESVAEIIDELMVSKKTNAAGGLLAVAKPDILTRDTIVQHNNGVVWRINADHQKVYLEWNAQSISLPVRYKPVADFIVENPVFKIEDIPHQMSDHEKIAIVDTLVVEGFLRLMEKQ